MLSDEEKKAIEIVKGLAVYYDDYSLLDEEEIEENELVNNSINIVVNLIEKQSKEIEELKLKNEKLYEDNLTIAQEIKELKKYEKYYEEMEEVNKKFIAVDKIKAKIEELEKLDFGTDLVSQFTANLTTITILQSLLQEEENNEC